MAISARALLGLPPIVTLMLLLSGCFQIQSPAQGAITGSPTTVHVIANPQMTRLSVTLDQKDITNQMGITATDAVGQVAVTPGPHTVAAAAMVGSNDPYAYPQPYLATASNQFCASQPRSAAKTVTPFAFADSKTWVNGTNAISLGPDATDGSTRWWLEDALPNSVVNHAGQIKWAGAPDCKCISSDGNLHGAPPMSSCDPTIGGNLNPTSTQKQQIWDGLFVKSVGNKGFYYFSNFATNLCLSERSGQLTQENCSATDNNQLWSLRDNGAGTFSHDLNPWMIDPFP
jgi:hypothetical protein